MEFDLDIDPNLYLEYSFFETTVKFAPANLGYARYVYFLSLKTAFRTCMTSDYVDSVNSFKIHGSL